jgi:hypothetical protein
MKRIKHWLEAFRSWYDDSEFSGMVEFLATFTVFGCVVLMFVAFYGYVIYVAHHFIVKFW